MQPHMHRGDDPEIAAAPPQRPEQVGFAVSVDGDIAAVAEYELRTNHVVDGQTGHTIEWTVTARQCQAHHANLTHHAGGGGQAIRFRGGHDISGGRAAGQSRDRRGLVDNHSSHQ